MGFQDFARKWVPYRPSKAFLNLPTPLQILGALTAAGRSHPGPFPPNGSTNRPPPHSYRVPSQPSNPPYAPPPGVLRVPQRVPYTAKDPRRWPSEGLTQLELGDAEAHPSPSFRVGEPQHAGYQREDELQQSPYSPPNPRVYIRINSHTGQTNNIEIVTPVIHTIHSADQEMHGREYFLDCYEQCCSDSAQWFGWNLCRVCGPI